MSVSIGVTQFFKVASIVISVLKECPLRKAAKIQLDMALRIGHDVLNEQNPREGLNRMLTHLESAYGAYAHSMGTWDIWDYEKVMWSQARTLNTISVHMALVHHVLGNDKNASSWLLDGMSNEGPWDIYIGNEDDLKGLDFKNITEFYKVVLGDKFHEFENKIIAPSQSHESSIEASDEIFEMTSYLESHRL